MTVLLDILEQKNNILILAIIYYFQNKGSTRYANVTRVLDTNFIT